MRVDLPVLIATLCFITDPSHRLALLRQAFLQLPSFCCIFFPQTPAAPPQLIPSLQREILAVGPLGFLLSFSCGALELFLAWGTLTVNPAGIRTAGRGQAALPCPQLSSRLWPTLARTALGLLTPLQGPFILFGRCYWKLQGTNSHLSNTIIKLSSVLVLFFHWKS